MAPPDLARLLVESPRFQSAITLVVVLCGALVGLETDEELVRQPTMVVVFQVPPRRDARPRRASTTRFRDALPRRACTTGWRMPRRYPARTLPATAAHPPPPLTAARARVYVYVCMDPGSCRASPQRLSL